MGLHQHQIIIVGAGLAGLRAALEAKKNGLDVAIISRVQPVRSHSIAAQGGLNAALGNASEDSLNAHAFDTVKGSDYLADQDAVEVMVKDGVEIVYEMEHWGCPFSRTAEGKIAQRPFGGAAFPRTCYSTDITGHVLLHTMYERCVKEKIKVYEEYLVLSLVKDDQGLSGLVALDIKSGEVETFSAAAVVFATGGYGRIFKYSTNAIINTGSGMAAVYLTAGVPLKDVEFVQFHPTSLFGTNILMTEGARGEGGYLFNNRGERFVKELAPRDIVARSIQTEINEGRGFDNNYVHLDLRHLGKAKIMERLPGIRDICLHFAGLDPIDKPIPIQPAQHYSMGGIDCDLDGKTNLPGLYAAGECACVSVHGANRLGGNSLLETIVFGRRAGQAASAYLKGLSRTREGKSLEAAAKLMKDKISLLANSSGQELPATIRTELKEAMMDGAGIFREKAKLTRGLEKVRQLKARYKNVHLLSKTKKFNLDLLRTLELEGMLELGEVILLGALTREESRGSHFRTDFNSRDDQNWLKHTLAHFTGAGPKLDYKPVTITKFQPQARVY